MHRLLPLLAILLPQMCLPVCAQLGRYCADFKMTRADFVDTVAIEWSRGQVYVPIIVDGQACRFLLDTGAGMSVVYEGTPLAQGSPVGNIISHDATGRTDTVTMVALPPLQLGSVGLYGCCATVQQRPVGTPAVDGILGFDLVNGGLSMKIDVSNGRLVVTDRNGLFDRERPAVITKYSLDFHVPYIRITPFGRCRERVLFDTGSPLLFCINKAAFDKVYTPSLTDCQVEGISIGRHAIGHGGTEPEGEVAFLQLDALRLGKYRFADVHCVTTQGGSHLGASLLAYGAVAFNPRKRTMMFFPTSDEQPCIVANKQLDIAFVEDSLGRAQVGLLWEQGISYRQGFRQGDIIEEIDHRPVRGFTHFVGWGFEKGREYVFTVFSSQGGRRDIKWVRRP